MKLLILNAGHCLSVALAREANRRGDLELTIEETQEVSAERLGEIAPDAVVIPPLSEPIRANPSTVEAHVEAVERCLAICSQADIALVWCVSDQLYEDGAEQPIDEHVVPAPRDESLRRLIATGDHIRASHRKHLIVRLGPLFALEGHSGWLAELIDALLAGQEVRAAEDVIFCPISVESVAMALVGMLLQSECGAGAWGAYHLAGTEPVSAYTFTSAVRMQLETRLEGLGEAVVLGELKALSHHHDQPLRRVLNCRRVLEVFGVHQKPWRLELGRMLDAWSLTRRGEESAS